MSQKAGCLPQTSASKDAHLLNVAVDSTSGRSDGVLPSAQSANLPKAYVAVMILSVCFGVAGLTLGAWATAEVKRLSRDTGRDVNFVSTATAAILSPHPQQVPAGYTLVMDIFRGSGYWASRPAMLYARSDFGAATFNGAAYLIGGLSTNNGTAVILDTFVEYNPVANRTTELSNMPSPRARFGWAVVGEELFLFGGIDAVGLFTAVNGTLVYNFASRSWRGLAATLNVPRTDLCAGAIGGKIYATGGAGATPEDSSVIEEFDPVAETWTVLPSRLALGRVDCSAVVSSNQLYVMGGSTFSAPPGVDCASDDFWKCYSFSSAVERFNPVDGSVVRVADMRYPRGDFGAVASSDGHIIVAGGESSDPSLNVTRLLSLPWVEEYSVTDDYWTPRAPLPESRFRFNMANAGDQVLAFGGHPTCANLLSPGDESACDASGLRSVFAFADVMHPPAYLAVRNTTIV